MARASTVLKAVFYLVVAAGLALYAYDLYVSMEEWSYALAEPPKIRVLSPTEMEVVVVLDIVNPSSSRVFARNVWYTVYANGYYVGEGFIPYLALDPGHNTVRLRTVVDVTKLPCVVVDSLTDRGVVEISVAGYMVVDLMLFGKYRWKQVTVPFNVSAYEVEVPRLERMKPVLELLDLVCERADDVLKALTRQRLVGG